MNWITLDEAKTTADMPSDVANNLTNWIAVYPDKAGRLSEITASVVAEFRQAIGSVSGNYLDPIESNIPDSCVRSAETIIYGTLQLEMGSTLSTAESQALTRADIFLRQISYGNLRFTGDGTGSAKVSPLYTPSGSIGRPERALPGGGTRSDGTTIVYPPQMPGYPAASLLEALTQRIDIPAGKKLVITPDGSLTVVDV